MRFLYDELGILANFAVVKYVDGGRDALKDGGLDCWGFFRVAREALGLPVPPLHLVSGANEIMREWETGRSSSGWRELQAPEDGCLVLFERPGRPYHCGIVLADRATYAHMDRSGMHFCKLDCMRDRLKTKRYYHYED